MLLCGAVSIHLEPLLDSRRVHTCALKQITEQTWQPGVLALCSRPGSFARDMPPLLPQMPGAPCSVPHIRTGVLGSHANTLQWATEAARLHSAVTFLLTTHVHMHAFVVGYTGMQHQSSLTVLQALQADKCSRPCTCTVLTLATPY